MSFDKVNNRGAEPVKVRRRLSGLDQSKPRANGKGSKGDLSSHRHGGVGGRSMLGQRLGTRDENSADGRESPTAGANGASREARLVRGEVGAVHSSDEAANHRGAKGPHLVEVNCEAKDRRWLSLGTR